MKPKDIFRQLVFGLAGLFCLSTSVASAEPTKILIVVRAEEPRVQSVGTETGGQVKIILGEEEVGTKAAEMLIAKHLLNANYQVLTSDDLTGSSWLTSEDIKEARKGNVPKGRKAAAFADANLLFSGFIRVGTSSEEVLEMEMSKAVATISYKLVDTASGKVLDLDSKQYRSTSRSEKEAVQTAFEAMATDITEALAKKVPSELSKKDKNLLAQYKKKFKEKETASKPTLPPSKSEAPQQQATACPEIIIISPPVGRGFEVVEKKPRVTVEGLAKDPAGIRLVKVNADPADLDAEGFFSYETTLAPGENRFLVLAMNKLGNTATKEFVVTHHEDKVPPEIVLMKPEVTRGFTVVVKETGARTLIEGMAKDDAGVLYVTVNGGEASLDKEGYFSRETDLDRADDIIVIEAADKVGNKTRKEFRIARGNEGKRMVESLGEPVMGVSGIKPVLWGLAIGVSRYDGTPVDLKYADDDAKSVVQFLKRQEGKLFSEVHFKTLVNEDVTRDSIIQSISTHLGKAAPNDVVFLFLAGHGIKHRQSGSYYFVPYDADFNSILSKGLRMSDFEEAVNILSKNVNKVIIAMDTCHSGAMRLGMRSEGSGEDLAETLREASGLFILAASKGGEESLEDEKFKLDEGDTGHGAFTYALIEGMRGKANYDGDSYISLNELFQYVAKQVPRLTDGRQHPYFRGEGTDIPFIVLKE